jgi:uncharacterized protein (DUF2461 family)
VDLIRRSRGFESEIRHFFVDLARSRGYILSAEGTVISGWRLLASFLDPSSRRAPLCNRLVVNYASEVLIGFIPSTSGFR